jgi:hypothetical protein
MGSGVRIPLAAPIQVLIDQTGGQGQQTRRHDLLLSAARINRDRVETRKFRCRAVRPDRADRRPGPRDDATLCLSATPGWQSISKRAVGPPDQMCHRSRAHPRACAAVDRPIGPSSPPSLKWVELPGQAGDTLARCALAPTVAGREEGSTTTARAAVLAEWSASITDTHATQLRPLCPTQFSPDMKRTHSRCYIPTTKSGGAPRRPPPQSPSPK